MPRPGARFAISSPPIRAAINPKAMQPNRAYWRACWSMPDARRERLITSHAVKKGRRYRYYVSAAPVTGAGTDLGQGWAGMPPAPEMSCAPGQLRLVPTAAISILGCSVQQASRVERHAMFLDPLVEFLGRGGKHSSAW